MRKLVSFYMFATDWVGLFFILTHVYINRLMNQRNISGVAVVDVNGKLTDVISNRDLRGIKVHVVDSKYM